jgi:hypothetical protein
MTPDEIRKIFREELTEFFAHHSEIPAAPGAVISLTRKLEIRRQAERDMAVKLRGKR